MTATRALQVAIADALEDSPALLALLTAPGIYSGMAAPGSALDYIVLGESSEGARSTFMQPGHEGTETLHIWSADVSKWGVQAIYEQVVAALDRVPLALSGHLWIEGRVDYVIDLADADGASRHLVARYRIVSRTGS